MKSQKPAQLKIATAPFQPRTGAHAPAHLSESIRARIAAELAKPTPNAGNDTPTAKAENELRQGGSETPQEPAV
jgi:hypothetical protein